MPGFHKFVKVYVRPRMFGSVMSNSTSSGGSSDRNKPRTRRERSLHLGESWLMKTNATIGAGAEGTPGPQSTPASGIVPTVDVDVEQALSMPMPKNVVLVRGVSGWEISSKECQ
jgi:hypothetical protein